MDTIFGGGKRTDANVLFYSNGNKNDMIAKRLLLEEEIPFDQFGPTSVEETPFIKWGFWRYDGIEEIKQFIELWKSNNLPDPWCGL